MSVLEIESINSLNIKNYKENINMKHTNHSIVITTSLITLLAGNAFAANNVMDVTQENSVGAITTLNQGGANNTTPTTNSTITVKQIDAGNSSMIEVDQMDADNTEAHVQQYNADGNTILINQINTNKAKINAKQDGGTNNNILINQHDANNTEIRVEQYGGGSDSTVVIDQSGGATEDNVDATNFVNITQGGVSGTNDSNNFQVTTQTGSGNKIVAYQGLPPSSAVQKGSLNQATLMQDGNESIIGFNQDGGANIAKVTQAVDSINNRMDVSQTGFINNVESIQHTNTSDSTLDVAADGTDNNIIATQNAVTGSEITLNIKGDSNNLGDDTHQVVQLSSESSMNITINGNSNQANLLQDLGSNGSKMTLSQGGDLNVAKMKQFGAVNTMSLSQETTGDINTAELTQNGFLDTMTVSQTNGGNAYLTQN